MSCYDDDDDDVNATMSTLDSIVPAIMFADDGCQEIEGELQGDYPPLDTSDDDAREFIPGELKIHLGKNLFAVAKKAYSNVDIRHHFFTDATAKSLHPTRRGINLSSYEFKKLMSFLPRLEEVWYGLKETAECASTHDDDEDLRECQHCTPRPPQPKKKNESRPEVTPRGAPKAPRIALKREREDTPMLQEADCAGDVKRGEGGDTLDLTRSRKTVKMPK